MDAAGVPCFIRGGFGVGAQTSQRWERHQRGGRRREFGWGGAGAVTSEGLIQVLFAKDDVEVMHSARVELHTENHVTGRAAKLLVVTLQLQKEVGTDHQDEFPGLGKGELGGPEA